VFGGEWVGAVVSVIVSVVMLLCVFFTGRPERCDHMRPHATTCDHALFISVLWSHIGDHASAATNHSRKERLCLTTKNDPLRSLPEHSTTIG
jgi:hypothetical protein